jgi:hypothetical protein
LSDSARRRAPACCEIASPAISTVSGPVDAWPSRPGDRVMARHGVLLAACLRRGGSTSRRGVVKLVNFDTFAPQARGYARAYTVEKGGTSPTSPRGRSCGLVVHVANCSTPHRAGRLISSPHERPLSTPSRSLSFAFGTALPAPNASFELAPPNGEVGWLPALGTRGFHGPLSDPRADLRLRFHGSERDGRNVPQPDLYRRRDCSRPSVVGCTSS